MKSKKLKFNFKYEFIIFIIEAICMSIELVAARVLSPYFGNTNIVWTSIIGIILLSSSIGNYIGGILADKKSPDKTLKLILLFASFFVFLIPIVQESLLTWISSWASDIKVGAIISTIILFFIPSLLLGLIIPIILKLKVLKLETTGKISGKIYAISTLGGIFGTFLSGFYLVPRFGSVEILFMLSIILLVMSMLLNIKKIDVVLLSFIIVIITLDIILFFFYYKVNLINGDRILNGKENIKVNFDTEYGRVTIYNSVNEDGEKIRILNVDGGFESATYTSKEKRYELVFEYTKYYDLMFKASENINDVLLIGGGGYSYPKYFISHYDSVNMDVVEIDKDVTKIAKKYFYLNDLIKDYNINDNKRLNLIEEDGRTYLNKNKKKYDAILNDAFSGGVPPKTLTTVEAVSKIKESLSDNGVYLTNVISSLEGTNSKFLKAETKTLFTKFKNVYVIPCLTNKTDEIQNLMVIASDKDITIDGTYDLKLFSDTLILTDDYCPVETLIQ